tara:strand:+ start:143 stop:1063 length:921 start_codon:yes stop_codon:yes gene_type:complete
VYKVDVGKIIAYLAPHFDVEVIGPPEGFEIIKPVALSSLATGTVSFNSTDHISNSMCLIPKAVLICSRSAEIEGSDSVKTTILRVDNPRLAFGKLVNFFFVPQPEAGVHTTSIVDRSSIIGNNVSIGPNVVIGPNCQIGDSSVIGANVVLERNITIGQNCRIGSGSNLGQPGFGIEQEDDGTNYQLPHIGGVILEDDVTIGSLCAIAGGTINPTYICKNVRIDDKVFIAHNVYVGTGSLIIASAEVSGSVHIGEGCWIGPNSSLMNKIKIGDRSLVGLGAVVTKSCIENVILVGSPARVLKLRYQK